MDYFKILNLKQEPFSNSPDPAFFFQSRQHQGCLQKVELSIRMRRGLNVIVGDVGTGKTTLCRQLIRKFSKEGGIDTHLILDPDFSSATEFLRSVAEMLEGSEPPADADNWQLKERIKTYIFRRGVDEDCIVVLIIDEGQKIPEFCLELLREFLNYETNEFKLLQIVIFAQKEFEAILQEHENFMDRINLHHLLGPLNFNDTRRMIRFRILQTSEISDPPVIFSYAALWAIYRATEGYPRKIIHLCHQSILAMIIQNKNRVNWFIVRSCMRRALTRRAVKGYRFSPVLTIGALFGMAAIVGFFSLNTGWLPNGEKQANFTPMQPQPAMAIRVPIVPEPQPLNTEPIVSADSTLNPLNRDEDAAPPPAAIEPDPAVPEPAQVIEDKKEEEKEEEKKEALAVAVAAPSPSSAPEEKQPGISPSRPQLLGSLTLKKNETLSWMCVKIYGEYNKAIRGQLIAVNPDIGNLNNLWVGRSIFFPAIPIERDSYDDTVWWVRLAVTDSLNEAFEIIRSYSRKKEPIRVISHWHPDDGLQFSVVLWGVFLDKAAAGNHFQNLAGAAGALGGILSAWRNETVFFTDPYLGKKR